MRRVIGLALIAVVGVSATASASPVVQRARAPRVYCHYRGHDGWQTEDVQLTIQCATHKFGVSTVTAMSIADRESGFQASAYNDWSGACGVFQHLEKYWPSRLAEFRRRHPFWTLNSSCFNARSNVMVAIDMARHGWGPWS